jgi:hypothetical protein
MTFFVSSLIKFLILNLIYRFQGGMTFFVMAAPKHPASASRPRNKLRARSPLSFVSLCQTVS